MTNLDNLYTKNFTFKIDGVLALPEPEFKNGSYLESETFSSYGPIGQNNVQWCLRLYPRGEDVDSKKYISIFLHLLDGNGSEEVRANCKFSIVNERGAKLNKQETKFCVHTLHEDTDYNGWGFHKFIGRDTLATTNNYIVHGHQLIVDCQIEIKKDMQLIEAREEKRRLREKLENSKIKIAELEQKLKKELKEKEENSKIFQNLTNEIREKDGYMLKLKKELKEKDKLVQNFTKEAKEKDELMKSLENEAKKKQDKLMKMREMLEETANEEQQQKGNNSPANANNVSKTILPSPEADIPSGSGKPVAPWKTRYICPPGDIFEKLLHSNNATSSAKQNGNVEGSKKMRLSNE